MLTMRVPIPVTAMMPTMVPMMDTRAVPGTMIPGASLRDRATLSSPLRGLSPAGGAVARPGFERLVAWLCAGEVGAVLCFDATRVAQNGRNWHHLLELCGLVEARVIDHDGVYDPCHPIDRLLLGMNGHLSEFELSVLRARMLEAARATARGELRISVPIGYVWDRHTCV